MKLHYSSQLFCAGPENCGTTVHRSFCVVSPSALLCLLPPLSALYLFPPPLSLFPFLSPPLIVSSSLRDCRWCRCLRCFRQQKKIAACCCHARCTRSLGSSTQATARPHRRWGKCESQNCMCAACKHTLALQRLVQLLTSAPVTCDTPDIHRCQRFLTPLAPALITPARNSLALTHTIPEHFWAWSRAARWLQR